MSAIVVYESLWGNTAAVARAIAEGLGDGAVALSPVEATADRLVGVELVVAGSPVLGFKLPTEQMRASLARTPPGAPGPADLSHGSLRAWLGCPRTRRGSIRRVRDAGARPLGQRGQGDRQVAEGPRVRTAR